MRAKQLRRFGIGLLAALVLVPPPPASAERIASRAEAGPAERTAQLSQVRDVLARDAVATALAAQGLTPRDVELRVAQLSDEDLRRLASNLGQIRAAGDVPEYIWILLAVFLVVSILAMIF